MTFAQALARIEELQREVEKLPLYTWSDDCEELSGLLFDHADSIVQLGKVAEQLSAEHHMMQARLVAYGLGTATKADVAYDKLMEGFEKS